MQRQLNAYNAHDLEAFLATYSDDARYVRGGEVVSDGKEALRRASRSSSPSGRTCIARWCGGKCWGSW